MIQLRDLLNCCFSFFFFFSFLSFFFLFFFLQQLKIIRSWHRKKHFGTFYCALNFLSHGQHPWPIGTWECL